MNPLIISGILEVGKSLVDRLFPDKVKQSAERAQAEFALAQLSQEGGLKEMAIRLSAIIADAQSPDPWTSRARPSFLYVVYVLLLWAIPMGVLTIFRPDAAAAFTSGFKAWLAAIPEEVLTLFGVVMTGYVAGRSWEKVRGVSK